MVDTASHADWPALETAIRSLLPSHLALEVWDEQTLHDLTGECFGSSIASFSGSELMSIRERIDKCKLVPMRALDHARLATIGDCLDITARLLPLADQGEIVVSNVLQHAISASGLPCELEALPPFDARSLGMLRAWRLASAAPVLRGAPASHASPPVEQVASERNGQRA